MRVFHYLSPDGKDPYQHWVDQLSDQRARRRILRRIDRIELDGHLGDHKYLSDGVSELRIDEGAGYRVYFGRSGDEFVLLLCGGDKSSQNRDIERAIANWKDYQSRKKT